MCAESFKVRVMWGHFDGLGHWHPNPNLKMSEDEQFRQNVESGFDMFPQPIQRPYFNITVE